MIEPQRDPDVSLGLPMARPEEVGLSSERLARLDDHLRRRYVEPGKLAGCLTLVARDGHVAWVSKLGERDRARHLPMTEDTIFRIYSMSKPITSVALMSLYEEGHFQLDDPVAKLIPEWRDLRVYRGGNHPTWLTEPCARPMTVRDLLTHTSGLTYGFLERTNLDAAYRKLGVGGPEGTLRDMVLALAELPLEFSPGTRWNYSVATDVCGYLVEVFSGDRFDRFLERRIFAPLGMADTGFTVPDDAADRFAASYRRTPDKSLELLDDTEGSPYRRPRTFFSGGGGLVSTAADYLRFAQMLLSGGTLDGARILGPRTIALMTQNHLPAGQELAALATGAFSETTYDGTGFGLGFWVLLDQVRAHSPSTPGELGWGGMASTVFWIDPAEDLVVLFLTQLTPSGTFDFRGQLRSIVYGAIVD
ncbi:MAG TPA: serine hydrolase domain-containing protein [Thermoanaerobaculia bacterium]|nr:serine hydrolase domain-containing protein [Thermoanaerobaculia bacterium]